MIRESIEICQNICTELLVDLQLIKEMRPKTSEHFLNGIAIDKLHDLTEQIQNFCENLYKNNEKLTRINPTKLLRKATYNTKKNWKDDMMPNKEEQEWLEQQIAKIKKKCEEVVI